LLRPVPGLSATLEARKPIGIRRCRKMHNHRQRYPALRIIRHHCA
jgi:hypothetical protein